MSGVRVDLVRCGELLYDPQTPYHGERSLLLRPTEAVRATVLVVGLTGSRTDLDGLLRSPHYVAITTPGGSFGGLEFGSLRGWPAQGSNKPGERVFCAPLNELPWGQKTFLEVTPTSGHEVRFNLVYRRQFENPVKLQVLVGKAP